MPALQVRDFPDDLYAQLKGYAEAHRRSIAQQTVACVEAVIRGVEPARAAKRDVRPWASKLGVEPDAVRAARSERRQDTMRLAAQVRWKTSGPTAEELAQLVRNERVERTDTLLGDLAFADVVEGEGLE